MPTRFDSRATALVVVDIQNDFCPGGALAVPAGDEVVPVANALIERFDHVILAQDWHPSGHTSFASSHADKAPYDTIEMSYGSQVLWPDHCVQGTQGARIHAALEWTKAEMIVRKGYRSTIDSYSAFFENDHQTTTGLAGYLRDRGFASIFVCGLAYDFCVRYTAEDAASLGFGVTVVEDACRAIDLDGSVAEMYASFTECGVECVQSGAL